MTLVPEPPRLRRDVIADAATDLSIAICRMCDAGISQADVISIVLYEAAAMIGDLYQDGTPSEAEAAVVRDGVNELSYTCAEQMVRAPTERGRGHH
jgi:hypothetical protein